MNVNDKHNSSRDPSIDVFMDIDRLKLYCFYKKSFPRRYDYIEYVKYSCYGVHGPIA